MADVAFRGTVCTMIDSRVEAIAEGKDKKAREYRRVLAERGVRLGALAETPAALKDANNVLSICRSAFPDEQIERAARLERWDTQFACKDEFTVHVLVGRDGRKIGHRLVAGY